MAQLPSEFPTLAIHLADKNRDPIITSSSSPSQLASLTSIAAGALVSHSAIQRIGLGRPERIMVEYPDAGAVIIETFLDTPESVAPAVAAGSAIVPGKGSGASSSQPQPPPPPQQQQQQHQQHQHQQLQLQQEEQLQQQKQRQHQRQQRQQHQQHHQQNPPPQQQPQQQKKKQQQRGQQQQQHQPQLEQPQPQPQMQHPLQQQQQRQQTQLQRHRQLQLQQQAPPPLKEAHSDAPPLMAGFVIAASPRDLSRASEALVRVEMLGRRLQEEWVEEVKRDPGFAREVDSEVMNLG
ncbi:hypothetical protein E4U44_001202 [Claviceps purpurea]|nr:hypothetical protein E4U44_001202 [Claviceps purpurea]